MPITNAGLESFGFNKFEEEHSIEVKFHSLNVYEIKGITQDCESVIHPENIKHITPEISLSIGVSLNDICNVLTDGKFAEDEEEWNKEKNTNPPYLMVLTSLPDAEICKTGYVKNEPEHLLTHDCFTNSKEGLLQLEKEKTYPFVTALSAHLSSSDHIISFIPIAREVFGISKENQHVRDCKITDHFEASISKPYLLSDFKSCIEAAFATSTKIHPKVGYFFDLAVREKDILKKFIYYFLVLEVHTHQVFKTLDYESSFSSLNTIPDRIKSQGSSLLLTYQKEARNLAQRFIWCALLAWKDITDDDINLFKMLKKTRDRIYHGEEVDIKSLPVNEAQKLALKMIKHD